MINNKVVSLFSGGGGLDLGFINAGFDIVWAIDLDKNAVCTYKHNIGNHIVQGDICKIDKTSIPDCDIIIGGPPCQAFSLAGKRDVNDPRAQLIWHYLEIIETKKPKAFVFENVTGILSAKDKEGEHVFPKLIKYFEQLGYTISYKTVNAADYGVPQRRKRVIIVGLKNGKTYEFPSPTHSSDGTSELKYVSVEEALSDLPSPGSENLEYKTSPCNSYQEYMREGSKGIFNHDMPSMSELDRKIISYVKPGGNYMDIPDSIDSVRIKRLKKEGGRTTYYGRMLPSAPSYTINTYFNRPNVGCNIHYSEDRLITAREALRLQSFPDYYEVVSTSKQGCNLIIGNAVPPLLAKSIAMELKKYV